MGELSSCCLTDERVRINLVHKQLDVPDDARESKIFHLSMRFLNELERFVCELFWPHTLEHLNHLEEARL